MEAEYGFEEGGKTFSKVETWVFSVAFGFESFFEKQDASADSHQEQHASYNVGKCEGEFGQKLAVTE